MSIPYEATGRTQQKSRTRRDLIDAARALIAGRATPTVEAAAAAADVSRTTAYRYFPTQRDLLVAAFPMIEQRSMLGDDPPEDVEARLDLVVAGYLRITIDNEPALRTALRLALDSDVADREQMILRQGRVIGWLEDALAPLQGQMPAPALARLVRAIRAAVGIEALVWLCDVAGLSRDEAQELMLWSARALLRVALDEAGVHAGDLAKDPRAGMPGTNESA